MNVVLMLAGLLLMALGAAEVVHWAGSRRLRKEKKTCCGQAVVLVLPEGPEDCECLIRYAGEQMRWGRSCRFLCVVKDTESREIARRLSERYKGLEVCGPGELERLLGAGAGL